MTVRESSPLVLVVEDYQDAREMYAEYLEFAGYRVATATNGLEALAQVSKLLPDIVLMDLALPQLDGWEATRRIKQDDKTRHIPVVALTGHALAGHAESAREVGCDAFVTKPCLPDALVAAIAKILGPAPRNVPAPGGIAVDAPTTISVRRGRGKSTSRTRSDRPKASTRPSGRKHG